MFFRVYSFCWFVFWLISPSVFKKNFFSNIYLFMREREREQGEGQRVRERESSKRLSIELKADTEPRPRVTCCPDWASQAPLFCTFQSTFKRIQWNFHFWYCTFKCLNIFIIAILKLLSVVSNIGVFLWSVSIGFFRPASRFWVTLSCLFAYLVIFDYLDFVDGTL